MVAEFNPFGAQERFNERTQRIQAGADSAKAGNAKAQFAQLAAQALAGNKQRIATGNNKAKLLSSLFGQGVTNQEQLLAKALTGQIRSDAESARASGAVGAFPPGTTDIGSVIPGRLTAIGETPPQVRGPSTSVLANQAINTSTSAAVEEGPSVPGSKTFAAPLVKLKKSVGEQQRRPATGTPTQPKKTSAASDVSTVIQDLISKGITVTGSGIETDEKGPYLAVLDAQGNPRRLRDIFQ